LGKEGVALGLEFRADAAGNLVETHSGGEEAKRPTVYERQEGGKLLRQLVLKTGDRALGRSSGQEAAHPEKGVCGVIQLARDDEFVVRLDAAVQAEPVAVETKITIPQCQRRGDEDSATEGGEAFLEGGSNPDRRFAERPVLEGNGGAVWAVEVGWGAPVADRPIG